ncbi:MAG: preprotein translocase subunit SecA [Methylophilaceae bacterium]|jgi:preprotein translocase subunit SecA
MLAKTHAFDNIYPERPELRDEEWLERIGLAVSGKVTRRIRARRSRVNSIVSLVTKVEDKFRGLDNDALLEQARELKKELRRDGLQNQLVAEAFALIRETADQILGMRHFNVQLIGGWVLLNGMVAEMETGEGKTLTATLPACTAAMAGIPVHVITVNDYLVERDCEAMRPVYEALGLSVAAVTAEMDHKSRQAAYACDVVYCSNKTIVFDYLRDRILLGASSSPLHLRLEKIYGADTRIRRLLLRGLHFAIVDEADSVLVDEARTPLIISSEISSEDEVLVAEQALNIAQQLSAGTDFDLIRAEHSVKLTAQGLERMVDLCKEMGGVWVGTLRREELVTQALTALYIFNKDEHYIIRDGKIQVVDEFTGRVMADRSWGQGLHQLIEKKEGCEVTPRREPLARISYQRFFRRYLHLSGMTGTAKEVAGELGSIYNLAVVRIPTHTPERRIHHRDRIFPTQREKWQAVAERVEELHVIGVPILLGTRSVADSEVASVMLTERGLAHRVLNAKQDHEEANIIASAGEKGQIIIATNMAGRGTDIKLGKGVSELGGLHVILSERHEAGRIDRQLAGRCARQTDPGSFEAILSMEDPVLLSHLKGVTKWLARSVGEQDSRIGQVAKVQLMNFAQYRTEHAQSKVRKNLLKSDRQTGSVLSFSGRPE